MPPPLYSSHFAPLHPFNRGCRRRLQTRGKARQSSRRCQCSTRYTRCQRAAPLAGALQVLSALRGSLKGPCGPSGPEGPLGPRIRCLYCVRGRTHGGTPARGRGGQGRAGRAGVRKYGWPGWPRWPPPLAARQPLNIQVCVGCQTASSHASRPASRWWWWCGGGGGVILPLRMRRKGTMRLFIRPHRVRPQTTSKTRTLRIDLRHRPSLGAVCLVRKQRRTG